MDFINILKKIITEQSNVHSIKRKGLSILLEQPNVTGKTPTRPVSPQGNQSTWKSGDKIGSVLKNPGVCKGYGERRGTGIHNACDMAVNPGTAIFAPHDGDFIQVKNSACGNGIDITGRDSDGKSLFSRFCHLRNREVPEDGKVIKGDLIGFTGGKPNEEGSGRTTGPHLHWSFKVNGAPQNPYTYN